jgi:hypothetical protein
MDIRVDTELACVPEVAHRHLVDLDAYPQWLGLVRRVDAQPDGSWLVELRGRLGPIARSKRLRMVRTTNDPPSQVAAGQIERDQIARDQIELGRIVFGRIVFEREELDGRDHGMWRLVAEIAGAPVGCRVDVTLHYSGAGWIPLLDRVLADEIERAKAALAALVATS